MSFFINTLPRFLFGLPLILFGVFHFMMTGPMSNMVPAVLPYPAAWVWLTGVALILAGVSLFIEKYVRLAMVLTALMLVGFVVMVHVPAVMGGNEASMPNILKDLAMVGGALALAGRAKS